MIPSFGVKKAQPAFQVKAAAPNITTPAPPDVLTEKNSLVAASPSASLPMAATPVCPVQSSMAPPGPALSSTSTLPTVAHLPLQDAEAGACSSDEDFEKENIHIDPKSKKPATKSKKLKVKKDPEAPKKPATSYMFFCKQERQNVMNELGNLGFTETGKEVARRWGVMDATEKAKWIEEAAKDKERFNKENAVYLAKKQPESLKAGDASPGNEGEISNKAEEVSGSDLDASHMFETMEAALVKSEVGEEKVKQEVTEKKSVQARSKVNVGNVARRKSGGKVKAVKETGGNSGNVAGNPDIASSSSSGEISAPVANYFAFLFSHWAGVRQEYPNSSPKDIQDLLWKQWSLASGRGVATLPLGGQGLEQDEGGPAKKKAKKEKRVKDPLAPKRPACAYLLFFHSMKAEVMASKPEMTYKEVMIEMGRVWNNELDEEQKAPFVAQRQQLLVEWKKAMQVYQLGDVQKGEVKEEDLKKIENASEEKTECADVVEGGILGEKGDLRSKEEPDIVQGVEQVQGGEVKEENCKGVGDMEIEVRGVGAEEVGGEEGGLDARI